MSLLQVPHSSTPKRRKSKDDLRDLSEKKKHMDEKGMEAVLPKRLPKPHYVQKPARQRQHFLDGCYFCCNCKTNRKVSYGSGGGVWVSCRHCPCGELLIILDVYSLSKSQMYKIKENLLLYNIIVPNLSYFIL